MSIPLDRLYHYIENVAQNIHGGDVLIYRFYPHGSKKIEDLNPIIHPTWRQWITAPEVICHDQEPLNYQLYQDIEVAKFLNPDSYNYQMCSTLNITKSNRNLRTSFFNIYDYCLLLHSEQRSSNVEDYRNNYFIPVYYWNHALLALDWFRYAQHHQFVKQPNRKTFLIYNRAWSGTREYRLKFADLLIDNNLVEQCLTSVGFTDDSGYYQNHQFNNPLWQPKHQLEHHFQCNFTDSSYSADFNINNYQSTDIEVVLETLFDDNRLHLTEKTLRPIACGQPFILSATHGSLEYLHNYGFKTFGSVIDETYDQIEDPVLRQQAIIHTMKQIANWTESERQDKLEQLNDIARYNQEHFFSSSFFNLITTELQRNLQHGFKEFKESNTSQEFINRRIAVSKFEHLKPMLMNANNERPRSEIIHALKLARSYYNKHHNK